MAIFNMKELNFRKLCFVVSALFICSAIVYKSFAVTKNGRKCSRNSKCEDNIMKTERLRSNGCTFPCTSEDCLLYADILLKNLNPKTDPCEDFYAFACGGYLGRYGSGDSHSVYDDLTSAMERSLKGLLDGLTAAPGSVFEKLKILYDSCLDIRSSDLNSVPAALKFLKDMGISEWPVRDPVLQFNKSRLAETMGRLMAYDEYAFMRFQASPYQIKDPGERSPSVVLMLPQNPLQDEKMNNKSLGETIKRIVSYFVSDEESLEMWEAFQETENVIAQWRVRNGSHLRRCESSRYFTLNCTEKQEESLKFLCDVWKAAASKGDLKNCFSEDTLHVSCVEGHYVGDVFPSLSSLSYKSIANYLGLRFFITHLDDMNSYLRLVKDFYIRSKDRRLQGIDQAHRWEQCVGRASHLMHEVLGYLYISALQKDVINDIKSMIEAYILKLRNVIENQSWISENLKYYLKKQLGELKIGFVKTMDYYSNETYVQNLLEKYNPTNESYLRNLLEYKRSSLCDVQRDSKVQTAFLADSFWHSMDFGLGLFNPPVYSHGFSKIWNYASIGSVISHEVGHNFNNIFDYFSMDDSIEKFQNRTECFANKYFQFHIGSLGKKLKIRQVSEEIIADNIGWMLSEKILEEFLEFPYNALKLPSVNYSSEQLAYISFAQTSCSVVKREVEYDLYKYTPYIPSDIRVIGILQNSARFSEVYNCSSQKYMNPFPKCTVFDE